MNQNRTFFFSGTQFHEIFLFFKRDKHGRLHGASRFVSEPCLRFRNTLPRSPSDNVGILSESHPDLELFHQFQSLDGTHYQVTLRHTALTNNKISPH